MKKFLKSIAIVNIVMMCFATNICYAHSGRTDSSGGHKDNKNKSGLGSYHYHCGGYPAHLHENGVCPYKSTGNAEAAANSSSGSNSTSSSNNANSKPAVIEKKADTISVNNAPAEMKMGANTKIDYSVESENINANVQWKSSDSNIVSVDSDGNLNALKEGTATITVSTDSTSKSFDVKVSKIEVESVSLEKERLDLQLGETGKLQGKVVPSNATNATVTWTTDNANVVTVDQNGNIKGVSVGSTKVNITSDNGKTASININVYEVFPDSITVNLEQVKIDINSSHNIVCNVLPDNVNNKDVTFESEDTNIAKVDENGKITPVKQGKTKIIISTSNNVTKTISVEVYSKTKKKLKYSGLSLLGLGGVVTMRKKFFSSEKNKKRK